jgi:ribosomal protein L11 methyltransferase
MVSEKHSQALRIRAYLPHVIDEVLDFAALALGFEQDARTLKLPQPHFQWQLIPAADWSNGWKQQWQPTPIGDRLIIYPAWLEPPSETTTNPGKEGQQSLPLRLDPGVAFGTGTHPTTQLCLEALARQIPKQRDLVLADIGCGSGILGIGAILLGAQTVYGIDNDPLAVASAQRNRHLNQIRPEQYAIQEGSIPELQQQLREPVDGVVCNILAEVIVNLLPQFTPLVKAQGWAVLSGILIEQAEVIAAVLNQTGWTVIADWQRGEWCCLLGQKRTEDGSSER